MSGHSKWSTIKRKKEQKDAARGKIFTRVIKEITIAARQGGGSVTANPRLRTAVLAARAENVPQANIDRAIARGTGELDGVHYEELVYEGYGPAGVALLVEAVTDNKNRTTSEMRHAFTKNGGNMGEAGCVAWMFDQKGTIVVDKDGVDEDEVMMVALDAGAEDIQDEGETLDVLTAVSDFEAVRVQLEESGFAPLRAEIGRIPKSTVAVAGQDAQQLLRLMEVLEDHDDVQHVYANFDVDDKVLEEMNG
ncbi:MAG: YebC/PmpR family DNA-binding transcriptional regulator [Gemmatimonadetes bacterium]|nr:YebC/PmpR family DNA-binding transcriptional regulator [Gemmatimonadota bacterium]MYD26685.1 YebC/PmpR family DNA-binding transcriptional regulator [Gemmatimonadota bacterium]MYI98675.1 YebC/PmpR family DNA-binding transcriptional regulator [Gemmatimonadota bacterium]